MTPTIARIQSVVAAHYGLPLIEMVSQRRSRDVAHPRQVGMFLAKHLTPHSFPVIGREFGKRDHTTVMYACEQVKRRALSDPGTKTDLLCLLLALTPSGAA